MVKRSSGGIILTVIHPCIKFSKASARCRSYVRRLIREVQTSLTALVKLLVSFAHSKIFRKLWAKPPQWQSFFDCTISRSHLSSWLNSPCVLSNFVWASALNNRKFNSVASALPFKVKTAISVASDNWSIISLFSLSDWCKLSIILVLSSLHISKTDNFLQPSSRSTGCKIDVTAAPANNGALDQACRSQTGSVWFTIDTARSFFSPHGAGHLHLVRKKSIIFRCASIHPAISLWSPHTLEIYCPLWSWGMSLPFRHRAFFSLKPSQAESISDQCRSEMCCFLASSRVEFWGNGIKFHTRVLTFGRRTGLSGMKTAPPEILSTSYRPSKANERRSSWIEVFIFFCKQHHTMNSWIKYIKKHRQS